MAISLLPDAKDPPAGLRRFGGGFGVAGSRCRGPSMRLPLSSEFERQFNCAGRRYTLFPRHCNPIAISLSTITRTQLIAAFARFSGIRVKVSAAIHAVCLRVRGRLTLCLCGVRNDRNYTHRKASHQAHGNLPRAMGRRSYAPRLQLKSIFFRRMVAGIRRPIAWH
jgi:hypothetical protein